MTGEAACAPFSQDPSCATVGCPLEVEVDLDLNAHANARAWHGDRKQRTLKQAKTLAANERALAVADKKAQAALGKVRALLGFSGFCNVCTLLGFVGLGF